jgi:branched-chain amino acid transport system permease protein
MSAGRPSRSLLPWALAGAIVLLDLFICVRNPGDLDRLLINLMLALSAFVTLHARLLSLANAGFMAIGAYASAILSVKLGLPVALSIPAAVLICAGVAQVIGLPVLRLKDVYLAICTLGFGEVVRVAIILTPGLTGGPTGANLSTGFPYEAMRRAHTWELVLVLAFLGYLFWVMSRSRIGRAFRALRENPQAAATLGIDIVTYRHMAFLLSAMIAGAAGAFYAHSVGSLDNGDFKFNRALDILSFAVLGGSGQWFGSLLGAGFLTALPILLREVVGTAVGFLKNFAQLPNILNGLALVLVVLFLPGGLASVFGRREADDGAGQPAGGPAPDLPDPDRPALGGTGQALLELDGVGRVFGGLEALADVRMTLAEGRVYGLIGPNGAGKTTLINLVSGLVPPTSGKVVWLGRELQGRPAHEAARAGIARTFQNIQLFPEMTVLENVIVGRHTHIRTSMVTALLRSPRERREEATARTEAQALLDRLGLGGLSGLRAGNLAYGDQRRVEIARALAMHPRLLLLDEPAAGMNDVETTRLGQFILELKRHGYTLLVVEHHMDLIMRVCDEIVVLNFGRQIAHGAPAEVARDEQVLEAYLGRD